MILILGYGRSGQAVAKVLKEKGQVAFVSDLEEKKEGIYPDFHYIWGNHPLWLLEKVDKIIVSPSIPSESEIIKEAKKRKIDIISELEWAMEQLGGVKLGITGTNGKSTTTSMVAHIFNQAGIKAIAAGNIGTPLSSFINNDTFEVYSIEISTFQLENMSKKLLDGALLLNITEDHLDRHLTFENYKNLKKKIFYILKEKGTGVAPEGLFPELKLSRYGYGKECKLQMDKENLIFEGEVLLRRKELNLLGEHNWENTAGAVLLSLEMGIDKIKISKALMSFKPLEHRMEIVDTFDGITFVNDSKGTNVDSVLKALTGVPEKKTILILGGKDKGADFSPLKDSVKRVCKTIFCIGSAREKILNSLEGVGIPVYSLKGLEEVFSSLNSILEKGDWVLLSPACASFDQYKNFEERGKHFKELVKKWKERRSQI